MVLTWAYLGVLEILCLLCEGLFHGYYSETSARVLGRGKYSHKLSFSRHLIVLCCWSWTGTFSMMVVAFSPNVALFYMRRGEM